MDFRSLDIDGLIQVTPRKVSDERGYFCETFREDTFQARVGPVRFVQDNQSLSARAGTIRGLHFQTDPFAQGKLVRCVAGALFDVAVDIRPRSASFGRWAAVTLSQAKGDQLWVPPGFAHGFCTLEPDTIVSYKVTAYYDRASDRGCAWNDPEIGIAWPDIADPESLSAKDRDLPALRDLPAPFAPVA